MNYKVQFGMIAAFLSALVTPVFAQPDAAVASGYMLTEEDFFADVPKVITASRMVQQINEAPAALTVIDRQMIEASGARNLVDLLRLVPGFIVGYWSGTQQMTTYQGLGTAYARQIQVMIDGRAAYIPSLGGVPWADLPLTVAEIKRIEVIRGPNAVNYGSNSFLAVINIITKRASDAPAIALTRRTGSNGERDFEVSEAINADNFELRATAARQRDDGFEQLYDSRDSNIINVRADYREQDGDRWSVHVGQATSTQGRGDYVDLIDSPRDVKTTSDYQQLRWESAPDNYGVWAFQIYRTYHSYDDRYITRLTIPVVAPNGVDLDQTYNSKRYDIELQHTSSPVDWLRLVWGGSLRQDQVASDPFFGYRGRQRIDVKRLFMNTEWRVGSPLLLHVGTMIEDHEFTGTDSSPRIAISYSPVTDHTVRVSHSEATRTPTAFEQRSNATICLDAGCNFIDNIYLSSGGLDPERIEATELAYVGRVRKDTIVDIRVYKNRVTDIISNFDVPTVDDVDNELQDFDNFYDVDVTGGEFQLTYRHSANRFSIAYAHNHVDAEGNLQPDRIEQSFPEESGSLLWLRNYDHGYSSAATFYYTSPVRHRDGDEDPVTNLPIGPIRRLDLQLSRAFKFGDLSLKVTAGVQNVFDDYIEYREENIFETRYYINLSGELN